MKTSFDSKVDKLSKSLTTNYVCLQKADMEEDSDILFSAGERISIAFLYLRVNIRTTEEGSQTKCELVDAGFEAGPDVPKLSLAICEHATIWNDEKLSEKVKMVTAKLTADRKGGKRCHRHPQRLLTSYCKSCSRKLPCCRWRAQTSRVKQQSCSTSTS